MQHTTIDPRTALMEYADALKDYISAPPEEQEGAMVYLVEALSMLQDQGTEMVQFIESLPSQSV